MAVAPPAGARTYSPSRAQAIGSPLALDPTQFTPLGPMPESNGQFGFGHVSGRINVLRVDPTATTARLHRRSTPAPTAAASGKRRTAHVPRRRGTLVTDVPEVSSMSISDIAIDPHDHLTIYAATGDLNFGSFSFGAAGVLKSVDGGATWALLGADVFTPFYPGSANGYPQYQAIGKVVVDPNDANKVIVGTKTSLYISYDAGQNWTGPCYTNPYAVPNNPASATAQRQDVTGLLAIDGGGGTTKLYAAIGTRGIPTPVQPDLANFGSNGVYRYDAARERLSGRRRVDAAREQLAGRHRQRRAIDQQRARRSGASRSRRRRESAAPLRRSARHEHAQDQQFLSLRRRRRHVDQDARQRRQHGREHSRLRRWQFRQRRRSDVVRRRPDRRPQQSRSRLDEHDRRERLIGRRRQFPRCDLRLCRRHRRAERRARRPSRARLHRQRSSPASCSARTAALYYSSNGDATVAAPSGATAVAFIPLNDSINSIEFYFGDITANFATSPRPPIGAGAQDNGCSSATFAGTPTGAKLWNANCGGDGTTTTNRADQQCVWFNSSQNGSLGRSMTYGGPFAGGFVTSALHARSGPNTGGTWGGDPVGSIFVLSYDILQMGRHVVAGSGCDLVQRLQPHDRGHQPPVGNRRHHRIATTATDALVVESAHGRI